MLTEGERTSRWLDLNRRAQLSSGQVRDATVVLYADHPDIRAELGALIDAESTARPDLEIGTVVGDGHLMLVLRPGDRPRPGLSPG